MNVEAENECAMWREFPTSLKPVFLVGLLIWFFFSSLQARQSNIYYVDKNHPSSSDSNPGTLALPWLTIQKGIDEAVAGDSVLVRAGTYFESLAMQQSGTAGAYIVLMAYPGEVPVVDGSSSSDDKLVDWTSQRPDYIVFDGFDVRNGAGWGIWVNGSNNVIKNCRVYDNGRIEPQASGILVISSSNNIIRSNEVFRNAWNGINCESTTGTIIRHNHIFDNSLHAGINIFPITSGTQDMESGNHIRYNVISGNETGIYARYQEDNDIIGNLIYDNLENGIFFHQHPSGPTVYEARTRVYNNTVVGNGLNGLRNANATHLDIRNNCFAYNSTKNATYEINIAASVLTGHTIDYNSYFGEVDNVVFWAGTQYGVIGFRNATGYESNGLSSEPQFVNRAVGNYRPLESSPLIDNGLDLYTEGVTVDLNALPRPQGSGFDIGAYEFEVDLTAPAVPVNVRIRP